MKKVKKVFKKASKILDVNGWTQGGYVNYKGEVCVSEAISQAARAIYPRDFVKQNAIDEEAKAVFANHLGQSYLIFNDADGRTKEGVQKALKECADKL